MAWFKGGRSAGECPGQASAQCAEPVPPSTEDYTPSEPCSGPLPSRSESPPPRTGRGVTSGNADQAATIRTQGRLEVFTGLERMRAVAARPTCGRSRVRRGVGGNPDPYRDRRPLSRAAEPLPIHPNERASGSGGDGDGTGSRLCRDACPGRWPGSRAVDRQASVRDRHQRSALSQSHHPPRTTPQATRAQARCQAGTRVLRRAREGG